VFLQLYPNNQVDEGEGFFFYHFKTLEHAALMMSFFCR